MEHDVRRFAAVRRRGAAREGMSGAASRTCAKVAVELVDMGGISGRGRRGWRSSGRN